MKLSVVCRILIYFFISRKMVTTESAQAQKAVPSMEPLQPADFSNIVIETNCEKKLCQIKNIIIETNHEKK